MNQIKQHVFKLLTTVFISLLISLLFCLSACQDIGDADPKTQRKGSNILTDYVKKPLDKAEGVNKLNDAHNKRIEDSIRQLDEY